MSDDTIPPAPETTPMLPDDDEVTTSVNMSPIPRGKAVVAMTGAILDMLAAVARLEATANAIARALDETAG